MTVREKEYGFLRDNALSLAFGARLPAHASSARRSPGSPTSTPSRSPTGWSRSRSADYVTSSSFAVDVMENWQSEYLQFFLYIFATVWLVQRGSSESKKPGRRARSPTRSRRSGGTPTSDSPAWARTGGWRTAVFARSLGLLMGALFLLTWAASSVAGWAAYNSEQLGQREDPVSWLGYLGARRLLEPVLQNWQSEMLAVGSMAIFTVYLRQRGSPESKPVGRAARGDRSDGLSDSPTCRSIDMSPGARLRR